MREIIINPCDVIPLGHVGETGAFQVQFDVTGWAETYGDGVYELVVIRPGETTPYIDVVTASGNYVLWDVSNVDTAIAGAGSCQLNYYVGTAIAKSQVHKTLTSAIVGASATPPDPYSTWLTNLQGIAADALADAQAAAQSATDAADSADAAEDEAENAADSATLSESWAIGGTGTRTGEDTDNAKYYSEQIGNEVEQAAASATLSESWAVGGTDTRAGEDANNSKYYSEQSDNAKGIAEGARDAALGYMLDSSKWATGQISGQDVPSTDPTYHNNSKYYSEQAASSATAADGSAEDAEAYAVGKRDGVDVTSGDPAYQNNSKYYATEAANSASAAAASAATLVLDPTLTEATQAAQAKATGDAIADVKSAISQVYLTDKYSVTQYGTIYHAFDFVAGHTYKLTNGTSGTANAYTFSEASSSGSQVEVIKENWSAGNSLMFTPTQNASAIKTYTNTAGTITIVDLSVGVPKLEDDIADLQNDVTDLQGNFGQIGMANTYGPTSNLFDFTESVYAGNAGYASSNQYDSWEFTASQNLTIYMSNIGSTSAGIYMQLCVYPSGSFNDPDYVRYRSSESNLPSSASPLSVTAGTKLIISTNKDNSTWRYVITTYAKSLSEDIMLNDAQIMQVSNMYYATYTGGVLHVEGNGINCDFSDLDFNSSHGVFELQNLTYNNAVIFDTVNDYLGPVRVHGEAIKGAKHGEEISDSVQIIADGVTLSSGDAVSARQITIYVESTIDTDEFKRYTVWTLNSRGLLLDTILVTLKTLNIDYVFGAGIISCQDDVNIAWLNKAKLTSDVLIGLNESTTIVTSGGTLFSRRVSVNSAYGDQRVAFTTYTGRKKLYYYTCYGSDISVPSGTVFASCTELEFM